MSGWIKLHRKLQQWEWRDSPKHVSVFLDLLLEANHQDNKYRGIDVKRGSLTTSYNAISLRTGVSLRGVRTVLKDLKTTGVVTHESANHFSIISICNWENYQSCDKQADNLLTSKRQATDIQTTTNKNVKNEKNERNTLSGKPDSISEIINLLNSKAGTKFKSKSANTIKLINARLREGYEISDFEKVIVKKCKDWLPDPKMCAFVRPITLFGTKFESYLNEAEALDPEQKADQAINDYIASELGGFFDE
jgi:uncharacterized phage protein (TIGR02220 family)